MEAVGFRCEVGVRGLGVCMYTILLLDITSHKRIVGIVGFRGGGITCVTNI